MKNYLKIVLVCLCLMVSAAFLTAGYAAPDPPTASAYEYTVTEKAGTSVKLAVASKGAVVLAIFNEGRAEAFTLEGVKNLTGTHELKASKAFNQKMSGETLQLTIFESDTSIKFFYVLDGKTSPAFEVLKTSKVSTTFACHTKSGTGVCDVVETDTQWWNCYWCCWALGC